MAAQRKALLQTASASTSTQSVASSAPRLPPQSGQDDHLSSRIKPVPSSFYTARPVYIDSLILLEDLARRTKRALQQARLPLTAPSTGLSPTTGTSRASSFWLKLNDLSQKLGVPLKASQYRHIVARLVVLSRYRQAVSDNFLEGQCGPENRTLALEVQTTLRSFSRATSQIKEGDDSQQDEFYSSTSHVDSLGRAYGRGRRKESSARVWVVPKHIDQEGEQASLVSQSILVNLQSLSQAFTRVDHREKIVYPLRLTGLTGVVNVFALVRGGGNSGQAGAIAHGIAKALVAHFDHQAKEAESKAAPDAKDLRLKAISVRDILAKGEWTAAESMPSWHLPPRHPQTESWSVTRAWSSERRRDLQRRARHTPGSRDDRPATPALTVSRVRLYPDTYT